MDISSQSSFDDNDSDYDSIYDVDEDEDEDIGVYYHYETLFPANEHIDEVLVIPREELFFKVYNKNGDLCIAYAGAKNNPKWPYTEMKFAHFIACGKNIDPFGGRPSGIYTLNGYENLTKIDKLQIATSLFPEIISNVIYEVPLSNLIIYEQDWDLLSTRDLIKFAEKRGIETTFKIGEIYRNSMLIQSISTIPSMWTEITEYRNKLISHIRAIRKKSIFVETVNKLLFGWLRINFLNDESVYVPYYLDALIEMFLY